MKKHFFDTLEELTPQQFRGALQLFIKQGAEKGNEISIPIPWEALTQSKYARHREALLKILVDENGFRLQTILKEGKPGTVYGTLVFNKNVTNDSIIYREGDYEEPLSYDLKILMRIGIPSFRVYCRGKLQAGTEDVLSFADIADIQSGMTKATKDSNLDAPVVTASYVSEHMILDPRVKILMDFPGAQANLTDAIAFVAMGATKAEVAKPSLFAEFHPQDKAIIATTVYLARIKPEFAAYKINLFKYCRSNAFHKQLVLTEKARVTLPIKGLRNVQIPRSVLTVSDLDEEFYKFTQLTIEYGEAEKNILARLNETE